MLSRCGLHGQHTQGRGFKKDGSSHTMRHPDMYGILQLLQGKAGGKSELAERFSWLKNLRTWFNATTTNIFHNEINKVQIALWIAKK